MKTTHSSGLGRILFAALLGAAGARGPAFGQATGGSGITPAIRGGTGQTVYTVGDILYANTPTTLAKLAGGASGQVLTAQGAGVAPIYAAPSGAGLGDFSGPASSTDNGIVRFDGTSGKNGQTSGVSISDVASTNITIAPIAANDLTLSGGSTGASLGLGQGANGNVTLTPTGTGAVRMAANGTPLYLPSFSGNGPWRITSASAVAPNADDQVLYFSNNTVYNPSTGFASRDVNGLGAVSFQLESHWTENGAHDPWFEWNLDLYSPASGALSNSSYHRALAVIHDWTTMETTWKFFGNSSAGSPQNGVLIAKTGLTMIDAAGAPSPIYGGDNEGLILSSSGNGSPSAEGITFKLNNATIGGFAGTSGNYTQNIGTAKFGGGAYTNAQTGAGELMLNNGTTDSPGIHFYTGNNTNFSIDANATGMRFVTNNGETGPVDRLTLLRSGLSGVGTSVPASKWEVLTASDTSGSPASFDDKYFTVGQGGTTGGNIFLSWNGVSNIGYIGALTPGIAWRELRLNPGGGFVSLGSTTEATTGGAGSLTTPGGIYAAKKIIGGSAVQASGGPFLARAAQTISALDIDWGTGNTFTKTLAANSTFTFSNISDGQTITVALTNTASNYTVTWPTVSWTGGAAPTQTTGAKTDLYTFIRVGATTYGSAVQNF